MPPYPPYGAAVAAPTTNVYGQGGGTPYEPNATVAYSGGGYGDSEPGRLDDTTAMWNANSFSDKKIRQNFIKKVFCCYLQDLSFLIIVVGKSTTPYIFNLFVKTTS